MTDTLSIDDGKALVEIARQAIIDHLKSRKPNPPTTIGSKLNQPRGVFVTLTDSSRSRELRGCIGNPFPKNSLVEETVNCAIKAATMDPRFEPIRHDEFGQSIVVELSVLTVPENIVVRNPLDLPLNIKVGRDGLMVNGGGGSAGLLLPQVAIDEGFDEEEFLSQCCMKAGLTPDAWVTGRVRVARFQGQIFSEERPHGTVLERKLDRDKT